jgi:hypothetical protein
VEKVGVCDFAGDLARSRRVSCSCLVLCCCGGSFFFFFLSLGTIPACSFYSLKEVQGYKMLVCGVPLAGGGAWRPRKGLIRWRCGLRYGGMASVLLALQLHVQVCVPLLEEWSLSFGIVATCPIIPGPIASVTYLSL